MGNRLIAISKTYVIAHFELIMLILTCGTLVMERTKYGLFVFFPQKRVEIYIIMLIEGSQKEMLSFNW